MIYNYSQVKDNGTIVISDLYSLVLCPYNDSDLFKVWNKANFIKINILMKVKVEFFWVLQTNTKLSKF